MTTPRRNLPNFDALRIDVDGHVAEITLTRPELFNRFDELLHLELPAAVGAVRDDPAVRAIVLASTGKVFSAGGDFEWIKAIHADLDVRLRALDRGRELLDALLDCPLPVVAAVHGDAIGLGATIVLACDAVVATRTAGLADTHVAIGLVAGDGGCVVWPQAAGLLWAKRYLMTGDRLPADDAFRLGLVTDLVDDPGDVIDAARQLARRMAALPPLAVQGTKRSLNRLAKARAGEVLEVSFAYEGFSAGSDDLLEALAAFREKRPGVYRGR